MAHGHGLRAAACRARYLTYHYLLPDYPNLESESTDGDAADGRCPRAMGGERAMPMAHRRAGQSLGIRLSVYH